MVVGMKFTVQFDYLAILTNAAKLVHFVLPFDAPTVAAARPHPISFSSANTAPRRGTAGSGPLRLGYLDGSQTIDSANNDLASAY